MATKTIADKFIPSHSWASHEITEWDAEGWQAILEFEQANVGNVDGLNCWHMTTRDGLDMLVTYWGPGLDGQYTIDYRAA